MDGLVRAARLADFGKVEEPSVRYLVASHTFVPDAYQNVAEGREAGEFRMALRFDAAVGWDGDRDNADPGEAHHVDRQRAEVAGLGPHQCEGATFEYSTTWWATAAVAGDGDFCHLFQLKAPGEGGLPVVTLSVMDDRKAAVRYLRGDGKFRTARSFRWTPEVWQPIRIEVRVSAVADGFVRASIDCDPFEGVANVALAQPGKPAYRPKWGLYRRAGRGLAMGDGEVRHKDVTVRRIADGGTVG